MAKIIGRLKILCIAVLITALTTLGVIVGMPLSARAADTAISFANSTTATTIKADADDGKNYIVFDLAKANVAIESGKYSGWGYVVSDNMWQTGASISGTHNANNVYYVMQSRTDVEEGDVKRVSGVGTNTLTLPKYDDIDDNTWMNGDKPNTDVLDVIDKWQKAADDAGRKATSYYIKVSYNANSQVINAIIENVWSSYQEAQSLTGGGISISNADSYSKTQTTFSLVGDNRLHSVRYNSNKAGNDMNRLVFDSAVQPYDAGTSSKEGTLVVIGNQKPDQKANGATNYRSPNTDANGKFVKDINGNYLYGSNAGYTNNNKNTPRNHWDSVMGATDNTDHARGFVFNGGMVYAGATKWENTTAIGGGGNGVGEIDINGGRVIAVASTTGTAIGGGIAHTGTGGEGKITIDGGEVFAYNFGQPFAETLNSPSSSYYNAAQKIGTFVAGTAIGGGSSSQQAGTKGTVTITGGTVYAESYGGSGIGGGNTVGHKDYTKYKGGDATITISGGKVTSVSKPVHVYAVDNTSSHNVVDYDVPAGTGIGGGGSITQNGGMGTVNITGGIVYANGIGGGNSTQKTGGDASVTMSGGTVYADSIGGGFSETQGYAHGTVVVTGGSLNSQMSVTPTNGSTLGDEYVYLTRIKVYDKDANPIKNAKVTSLALEDLRTGVGDNLKIPTYYLKTDANSDVTDKLDWMYTDENGLLYLWIPNETAVINVSANDGTTQYDDISAVFESDGKINAQDVGIVQAIDPSTPLPHKYIVKAASGEGYQLYTSFNKDTQTLSDEVIGPQFVVENTALTLYIRTQKDSSGNDYKIIPCVTAISAQGVKTFQRMAESQPVVVTDALGQEQIVESVYQQTLTITQDTNVWFEMTDTNNKKYLVIDLTAGNVTIEKDPTNDNALVITQNGYSLNGFSGEIHLTTGGYPTSNSVTVDSQDVDCNLFIDGINSTAKGHVLDVLSGTTYVSFSEDDNLIASETTSAINVEQDATVVVTVGGQESLKINGASGQPAISGTGTFKLVHQGGFLKLNINEKGDIDSISVGNYIYSGSSNNYPANLNKGDYTFDLIGYYDQTEGKLYDKSSNVSSDTTEFYARGVFKVFTNVKSNEGAVTNGNFVITLNADQTGKTRTMGDVAVGYLNEGGTYTYLVKDVDYTWNWTEGSATGTLTIKGSAFEPGNLFIFAAANGEIAYQAGNYSGYYDGQSHGILLITDTEKFVVYYSDTTKLTAGNYTDGQTTPYAFTNATITSSGANGAKTIYWYITANPEKVTEEYNDVSGQNTVTILTAENEWSDDLTCPNVIVGNNPNPYAKAKWGVVQYEYFASADGTNPVEKDANGIYQFQADTYYYVRAYVPAMVGETYGGFSVNNYDQITTTYLIRFRAYETSVFSTTGKTFVQLTNKDDVKMPANGALSVYFVTNQANNMKLTFDKALYAKTKITMIIFGDTEQSATFYYYIVQQDDVVTEILLTSFVMMGSTNNYEPPQSGVVKAQFAIDVPDDKSMTYFTVALEDYNSSTDLQAPVTILASRDESLSVDENSVTDEIAIPVSVSATGVVQGEDYVALAVTVDGTLPAEKQVYIVREDTGAVSTPVYATNNYFVFSLGNADMASQRYVVCVKNLADGGSYSITTDVRVVTTSTAYEHCLAGKDENNSKTVANLVYNKPVEISITELSSPIVKQGQQQQLSFVITSNKASDYLISATLYEKTPNGFFESAFGFGNQEAVGFGATLNVPEKTNQGRNQVTITLPDNMPAGVYRVVFELDGATCQTEFIVS